MPVYAMHSIQAFAQMNPSFEIHIVERTESQLDSISEFSSDRDDQLIAQSKKIVLSNDPAFEQTLSHARMNGLTIFQSMLDVLRLLLIHEYGGIYLDCDTFPVQPFDDVILQLNAFNVTRHAEGNVLISDNYFLGAAHSTIIDTALWKSFDLTSLALKKIRQTDKDWWKSLRFIELKKQFRDASIKIGDYISDPTFYVDHYAMGTWRRNA